MICGALSLSITKANHALWMAVTGPELNVCEVLFPLYIKLEMVVVKDWFTSLGKMSTTKSYIVSSFKNVSGKLMLCSA